MAGSSARRVAAQEGDNQLVVEGVSKRFGGVVAVQDVSLEVPRGAIVSIIGPNGAGKTSLLNMISGFYKPDTGRVVLEGQDITQKKPSDIAALGIARTFQNIALFSGLTVLDNLMLGRHVRMKSGVLASVIYWGMAQKEDIAHREACEEIIDFLKLQDLRKQPTAALAYGLRKRVELGRALALEPQRAAARRADGRHEPGREGGHGALHPGREPGARRHRRADRARHGRGHGHLRPCRRARSRPAHRRRHAGRGPARSRRHPGLSRHQQE